MLKKNLFGVLTLLVGIMLVFGFAACDGGGGDNGDGGGPQKATYVSTDSNGNKYTLEINESGGRSARSAARSGDTFKLTVEYSTVVGTGSLNMKFEYSGTVSAAQTSGASVSLTLNINGETITITIVGTQMTVITGRIVNDNGQEVVNNPGPVTPVNPNTGGNGAGTQADPFIFTGTGGNFTGSLTTTTQALWYSFTANGRYTLTVRDRTYVPTNATTSPYTLDAVVTVLDASLQFVSSSGGTAMNGIDIGANNQSPVTLNSLTPGGVYYVKIDRYSEYSNYGFFYIGVN